MRRKNNNPMLRILYDALWFVPIAVLVALVNVKVDPANLFRRDYEYTVAQIVTSGQNASELKNMDDRTFQKYCAKLLTYTPDTLVLGSSRAMQITARDLHCETLFNVGVTNGDLRDFISFYLLYKQNNKLPRRVILMTDYCIFNPAKLDGRAYTDGYQDFAKQIDTQPILSGKSLEKWKQVFSPSYFQTAVRFLLSGGEAQPVMTTEYEAETDMRRSDGSYSYNAQIRNTRATDITDEQAFIRMGLTLGEYDDNSAVLRQQFEAFVDQILKDGMDVVFYFPPIHPAYYRQMQQSAQYCSQIQLEEYFKSFADNHGIKTFGSYDAFALGLTEADFHDGLHCSLQATQSILPEWLTEN